MLDVVGLTRSLVGEHTPFLRRYLASARVATLRPSLPAVTSTVQASMLTGQPPSVHGIVGNGWYDRDDAEVRLWRRSARHIQAPCLWETAREKVPGFTTASIGLMHSMFSTCDYVIAARPSYPADGRKIPDCYGKPNDLRHRLQRDLGTFPLFKFWGPAAGIESSRWLALAGIKIDQWHEPHCSIVYLPHLDYCLQKFGPNAPQVFPELRAIDAEVERLVTHFESRDVRVIILSEYGITHVKRPVHLNRALRQANLLGIRDELGRELLEPGDSRAFAVADHQIAHVYVNDPADVSAARQIIERVPGVGRVYAGEQRREIGLDHPRSGELVVLAEPGAWFTYYYWLDDARMPDFARTVDIHRKPGYDPAELFLDPTIRVPAWTIGRKLIGKKLGFRTLMTVIPPEAGLVRGSHGLHPGTADESPIVVSKSGELIGGDSLSDTDVRDLILRHAGLL